MAALSDIAERYYTELGKKNIEAIEPLIHPDIEFVGSLAAVDGKENVLEAARGFANVFDTIKIKETFENEPDKAMIVFDIICPDPIGTVRAANLMTIKDGLITKMNLFYDSKPFERKKKEIFSN